MRKYALAGVVAAGLMAVSGCGDPSTVEPSASASVSATAASNASGSSSTASADVVIKVVIRGGTITTDKPSPDLKIGDTVEVIITSDVDDEVHNHLNDQSVAIRGGKAILRFVADKPGIYEIELEGSSQVLLELRIS